MIENYQPRFDRTPPDFVNCPRCGGRGQILLDVGRGTWYDCGTCKHTGFIPATTANLIPIYDELSKRRKYVLEEIRRRLAHEEDECNKKFDGYVVDLHNAENEYMEVK